MRFLALVLAVVMMLSVAGCAKKTASEQLADDAKRAADQINRDVKNLFK
jgi:outer membrane lipoprotein SlyB